MKIERITSQKKIIIDFLKKTTTHPSAENVYIAVRKKLPRISRGTVYRILKDLGSKNRIQEILDKRVRYDGNISPHAHFFCEKCNKVFDVFEKYEIIKNRKTKVGKIKNYQIYFYGTCKNCSKK